MANGSAIANLSGYFAMIRRMHQSGDFLVALGSRLFFAVVAIPSAFDLHAETLHTYHNTRFGTTAQVPASWTMNPPPENNDGRSFSSPDKRATIIIVGSHVFDRSDEMALRGEPLAGETITYMKRGRHSVVISGIKGDLIFYRRTLLTCRDRIANILSIEYPKTEKKKYDAFVAHLSASLRGGPGYEFENDECD